MAKHFKQDPQHGANATRKMPSPKKHDVSQGSPARVNQYATTNRQYENSSLANGGYGRQKTVQRNDFYFEDEQEFERGGIFRIGRGICLLVAIPVRLLAIFLFVLVILNAVPVKSIMHYVTYATDFFTFYIPWQSLKTLAVDTPFGGLFRCDLCLFSLFLFVADWLFCRIRAALV